MSDAGDRARMSRRCFLALAAAGAERAAQRAVSQRRVVLGCASPRRYVGANQMKRGAEEVNKETELIMT